MGKTSLRKLEDMAAAAFRKGDYAKALNTCRTLEKREPENPVWARRLSDIHRRMGRREEELDALLRAADLYASKGFVIQAIAACKTILSIDPSHCATQERLDGLCAERDRDLAAQKADAGRRAEMPTAEELGCDGDTPLEEIVLTEVVYGAQPAHMRDQTLDGVSEIPLDTVLGDGELDLRLPENLDELAPADPNEAPEEPQRPTRGALREAGSAREQLERTPLFGCLGSGALRCVIERVRLLEIAEGEVLFRQGAAADALYVVVDGAVIPIAEVVGAEGRRVKLAVLEEGDFFGEVGLVTNQPRNATIQALVDTKLLVIDRAAMWDLIRREPEVLTVVLRFLRERLIDRLVRTSPIFAVFARADRSEFVKQFRFFEVRDQTTLIEQGEVAEALFVLLAGRMQVVYMDADNDKVLNTLQPGDICGERSLLLRDPAMAAVVASGKCWVLALEESNFRRILLRNPRLQQVVAGLMQTRERENIEAFREPSGFGDGEIGLI